MTSNSFNADETPGQGGELRPPAQERPRRFRRRAFASGLSAAAAWTARGIVVLAGLVILWLVIRALWSVVLPGLLALLLASILWPPNRIARRILPNALAALVSVLGFLALVGGIGLLVVPSAASGTRELIILSRGTLTDLSNFLAGPPLNLENADLINVFDAAVDQAQAHTGEIITGITSGLGTLTSGAVVLLLTIVFAFFCLKDGDRFLAWTSRWTNSQAFTHAAHVSRDSWQTLSVFIAAQAAVALVDAVFIGLGLWLLDIPLALPLAVLIFFGAFIPIVGAIATGLLATVVALLAHGWVTALIVLALVIVVQQLESVLLQPMLVGRTLKIHPAVVLASVTAGGTLFGIVGAFLAVPTTAVCIVVLRYLRDLSLENQPATSGRADPPPGGASPAGPDPAAV